MVLYDQTGVLAEEYMKRLSVSEKRVVLHSVRMTDEGSFTVKDSEGKVKIRTCLNVRGKWRSELYSILSALIDHSVLKWVILCACRCFVPLTSCQSIALFFVFYLNSTTALVYFPRTYLHFMYYFFCLAHLQWLCPQLGFVCLVLNHTSPRLHF